MTTNYLLTGTMALALVCLAAPGCYNVVVGATQVTPERTSSEEPRSKDKNESAKASSSAAATSGELTTEPQPSLGPKIVFKNWRTMATHYGKRKKGLLSLLQRRMFESLAAEVNKNQKVRVENDAAANAMAIDICRGMRSRAIPLSLREFALRTHGLIDPSAGLSWIEIHEQQDILGDRTFDRWWRHHLKTHTIRRAGIGTCSSGELNRKRVMIALLESPVKISPIPRRLARGRSASLRASVSGSYENIRLIIAEPSGKISVTPMSHSKGNKTVFTSRVRCEQRGVYQVEMMGDGKHGPKVLANFPLYCMDAPAREVSFYWPKIKLGSPAQIEANLYRETNAYRKTRGLPPLERNDDLARVAREHSRDMMVNDFFGHHSPGTGTVADRVKRSGLPFSAVEENLAMISRPDDVIPGLVSPTRSS
jgi:hypothetical protein